jgi:hypothetical protein
MTYTQLPIARQLEDMWVSWIHENATGDFGGGCFWQGRDGLDFNPGYLLHEGTTSTHSDVSAQLTFNEDHMPTAMHVEIGDHWFDFVFESVAGPLHMLGRLVESSLPTPPVRSWCWIEYAEGMLSPEILDLTTERFRLVWSH